VARVLQWVCRMRAIALSHGGAIALSVLSTRGAHPRWAGHRYGARDASHRLVGDGDPGKGRSRSCGPTLEGLDPGPPLPRQPTLQPRGY